MIPAALTNLPIGLDLGSRFIRAAQAGRSGAIIATASLLRNKPGDPYGPEDFQRLCGMLYRRGFRGREVVVTAPKAIIQRTSIDLPPRDSGAPLAAIARSELARQAHQESASFEFAWWDAPQPPRHGSATRAITVSCEHEKANALIDNIEESGLIPLAMLCPSSAAAVASPSPQPGTLAGALDLGWSEATFVLRSNTEIVFERQLSGCDISRVVRSVAGKHRLDAGRFIRDIEQGGPPEAAPSTAVRELFEHYLHDVRDEMRSSIEYLRNCEGAHEPAFITVLGGGARTPGVADAVARATEITTTTAAGVPAGGMTGPAGSEMAAAVAVACSRDRYTIVEAA